MLLDYPKKKQWHLLTSEKAVEGIVENKMQVTRARN